MTTPAGAAAFVPAGADLDGLRAAAAGCRGCDLWEPATQTVFGRGPADAAMMLVGEVPGDVEDQKGMPFVGPAGRLLVQAVEEAGIDKTGLYVTNAVKHFRFSRAANGRRIHQTPDLTQMVACRPWLSAELNVVRPRVVVILGATAGKTLLGNDFRVTKQRGIPMDGPPGSGARMLATLHPSAVLRTDADRRKEVYDGFVGDLRTAASLLDSAAPTTSSSPEDDAELPLGEAARTGW